MSFLVRKKKSKQSLCTQEGNPTNECKGKKKTKSIVGNQGNGTLNYRTISLPPLC